MHLIMEVRGRRETGIAHFSDFLTFGNFLSGADCDPVHMAVQRYIAKTMTYLDTVSVPMRMPCVALALAAKNHPSMVKSPVPSANAPFAAGMR